MFSAKWYSEMLSGSSQNVFDDHGQAEESLEATQLIYEDISTDDDCISVSSHSTMHPFYANVVAMNAHQSFYTSHERQLTEFEKEHFLPENVTPDKPCTATF